MFEKLVFKEEAIILNIKMRNQRIIKRLGEENLKE
jgi:hypothetical protein